MENEILISFELAKNILILINDAKHPHHENKVVEQVRIMLSQCIQQSQVKGNVVKEEYKVEKE